MCSKGSPVRYDRSGSKAASEPDTQRASLAIGAVPSAVKPKMISHERKSAGCRATQLRSDVTVNDPNSEHDLRDKETAISTNVVDNSVHNTERHHHLSTIFATVNL